MSAGPGRERRSHHFLQDEQGDWSMARSLLLAHTLFNWAWMWGLMLGLLKPPSAELLTVLIGGLDVSMFMVFGTWAAGPRIARYITPWAGAAVQAAGEVGRAVVARLKGTDRHREDDER